MPGGGTVRFVSQDEVVWATGNDRHVGGTPNIAGVIALGRGIDWLADVGLDWIEEHEKELGSYMFRGLNQIEGITLLGNIPPSERLGVASFEVDGFDHAEVSTLLNNRFGIATRNGCFCAHPYLQGLLGMQRVQEYAEEIRNGGDPDLPGAVRATIGVYNTQNEIDQLLEGLRQIVANPKWKKEVCVDPDLRCQDYA